MDESDLMSTSLSTICNGHLFWSGRYKSALK